MTRPLSNSAQSTNGDACSLTDQPLSAKHIAILDAATKMFLEQGYSPTSMDAIARAAGVSKQTIYNQFADKSTLFGAVIKALCNDITRQAAPVDLDSSDVQAGLTALADWIVTAIISPTSVALYRVIISEGPNIPELGEVSYRAGTEKFLNTVAEYLRRRTACGDMKVEHPLLVAEQFLGMLSGRIQMRMLVGIGGPPDSGHLELIIDHAVDAMIKTYGSAE